MKQYDNTHIDDAWRTLFEVSAELEAMLRRQPAQVIDLEDERKKRAAQKGSRMVE